MITPILWSFRAVVCYIEKFFVCYFSFIQKQNMFYLEFTLDLKKVVKSMSPSKNELATVLTNIYIQHFSMFHIKSSVKPIVRI